MEHVFACLRPAKYGHAAVLQYTSKKFVLLVKALLFHVFQQIKLETLHNNMNLLYFK